MGLINKLISIVSIFDVPTTAVIVEFVLLTIVLFLIVFFICYFVRRLWVYIISVVSSIGFYLSYIFELEYLSILFLAILIILLVVAVFTNLAEFRKYLANKQDSTKTEKKRNNKKKAVPKLINRDDYYQVINKTVQYLSKNKIGAIMTFEKKDDLSTLDFPKNGVEIDSPITFEILITIFYPGTRLHDGAVIIKGNTIKYASVFYNPSTKPLSGKYGSRHRAALGISEICDAVTVVVSEETGRISIAYNGEIFAFSNDDFIKAFANFMQEEDVLSADGNSGGRPFDE